VCGDREADIYELYDQVQAQPPNLHVLVRSQHHGRLTDGTELWESVAAAPLGGTMLVKVPRRKDQPAREATLELRWLTVEVRPPAVALKKSWPALQLCAVLAQEVGAPAGSEPIVWRLLTTWPVQTLKMARRLVWWYALRWGIECWHQVLKGVCRVEAPTNENGPGPGTSVGFGHDHRLARPLTEPPGQGTPGAAGRVRL
jgi:hypothetical protein